MRRSRPIRSVTGISTVVIWGGCYDGEMDTSLGGAVTVLGGGMGRRLATGWGDSDPRGGSLAGVRPILVGGRDDRKFGWGANLV